MSIETTETSSRVEEPLRRADVEAMLAQVPDSSHLDLRRRTMTGINLSGMDLARADLSGAELRGAEQGSSARCQSERG